MSDLELGVSQKTIQALFTILRDKFKERWTGTVSLRHCTIDYDVGIHLENGSIDLQSDGTAVINGLDIVFDRLILVIGVDLPNIRIGGFCLIDSPFGCLLKVPDLSLFEKNPDIRIRVDLSNLIQIDFSAGCTLTTDYFKNPAKSGMNDWDAHKAKTTDKWRVLISPQWVHVEPIVAPDEAIVRLLSSIDEAVDDVLSAVWWVRDIIDAQLGGMSNWILRAVFGSSTDIKTQLSNLLSATYGLDSESQRKVVDFISGQVPIFSIEDPYPIFPAEKRVNEAALVPVLVRMQNLKLNVLADELVISADM